MQSYWTDGERKLSTVMRKLLPGKARSHIQQFDIKPGDPVWLICRVSERVQKHNHNDDGQEAFLRQEVERHGGIVVGVTKITTSGFDPQWMINAAEQAGRLSAILLAETTDRFVRHRYFHSVERPHLQANRADLDSLTGCTNRVRLMTYLDSEATPGQVRSQHVKRGQWAKGNKGGGSQVKKESGYMKKRMEKYLPIIRDMVDRDATLNEMAEETGLPRSTISDWRTKYC